jgi:hypothetical protein
MARCGLKEASQTPRIVRVALENLFLLLVSLSSRGLNLWAIDKQVIGLLAGQITYVLPPGTIDVLNVLYSQPTFQTSTITTAAANQTVVSLSTAAGVQRYGFTPASTFVGSLLVETSPDGTTWSTQQNYQSQTWAGGVQYWYDFNGSITASQVRFTTSAASMAFSAAQLATALYNQKMSAMNRDDYTNQPVQNQPGRPSTNYFFEKLVNPQISLWPVTTVNTDQMVVWRHRQIQDIGNLRNQIEVPNRWLEPIIWQLARRLCFEVPEVDPNRIQMVKDESDKYLLEGEMNESDHLPIFVTPQIRGYTR